MFKGGSGSEEVNWDIITPGKHSDTRIKPLAATAAKYIAVTTERVLSSAGGWPLHISYIAVINL
jgi:hypothetical protein